MKHLYDIDINDYTNDSASPVLRASQTSQENNKVTESEYDEFKKLMQQLDNDDFDFKSEMPEFYNDSIPNLKSLQAIREDSPEAVEYNE